VHGGHEAARTDPAGSGYCARRAPESGPPRAVPHRGRRWAHAVATGIRSEGSRRFVPRTGRTSTEGERGCPRSAQGSGDRDYSASRPRSSAATPWLEKIVEEVRRWSSQLIRRCLRRKTGRREMKGAGLAPARAQLCGCFFQFGVTLRAKGMRGRYWRALMRVQQASKGRRASVRNVVIDEAGPGRRM
jgi:hypothetical protein